MLGVNFGELRHGEVLRIDLLVLLRYLLEPAEKSYIEWFLEGKSRSVGPILSLFDPNTRNIQLHFLLI
jgi:hypothetical protein